MQNGLLNVRIFNLNIAQFEKFSAQHIVRSSVYNIQIDLPIFVSANFILLKLQIVLLNL